MGDNKFMAGNLTSVPTVTITPAANATDIPVNPEIVLTFSKPMKASTIDATNLTLTPPDHAGLTMSWDEAQKILTIIPKAKVDAGAALKYGTEYTLALTAEEDAKAMDIFGAKSVEAVDSSFTTAVGNAPTLTTLTAKALSKNSAQFSFNYSVSGGNPVTNVASVGVVLATNAEFTANVATHTLSA